MENRFLTMVQTAMFLWYIYMAISLCIYLLSESASVSDPV